MNNSSAHNCCGYVASTVTALVQRQLDAGRLLQQDYGVQSLLAYVLGRTWGRFA